MGLRPETGLRTALASRVWLTRTGRSTGLVHLEGEPPLRDSAGISPDFARTVQAETVVDLPRRRAIDPSEAAAERCASVSAAILHSSNVDSIAALMADHTSTTDALDEDPRPDELRSAPSLVLVNTGNGKGKSSSAFGMMLRAVAVDWNVAVVQFIKSGNWKVGEEKMGRQLGVDWHSYGHGFTWDSDNLDTDKAHANDGWSAAKALIQAGEHRLVVLDELTYLCTWGWVDQADVIDTIAHRPEHVNVIVTGRDAPAELIEIADTVTEMTEIKHAYQQGIRAKRGIDY